MDRCPQCRGPLSPGFAVFGIEVRRCLLTGRPVTRLLPAVPIA